MADELEKWGDLQREEKIMKVLELMFAHGKTIGEAQKEAKVTAQQWFAWQKLGHTQSLMQKARAQMDSIVYETLMPSHRRRMEALASIAVGQAPTGTGLVITATHMMKAMELIDKILPITAANQSSDKTDMEHLASYLPKQLIVINNKTDYIYNGSSDGTTRHGQMSSILDEYIEVPVSSHDQGLDTTVDKGGL